MANKASGLAGVNLVNLGVNLFLGELLGFFQKKDLKDGSTKIVPKTIKDASFTTPVDGEAIPVVYGYKYLSSELKTIYAGGFSSSKVVKRKDVQVSLFQTAHIYNEVAAIYSYNSLIATVCHKGGTILSYTVTPDADPLTAPAAHGFANSTTDMHVNQSGFIAGLYMKSSKNWPINGTNRHYNELPLADNKFGVYYAEDLSSATLYRRTIPTSSRLHKVEDGPDSYSSKGYSGYFSNGSPMYSIGSLDDSDPYLVRYKTPKCKALVDNDAAPYTPNSSWISFSGAVGTEVNPAGFGAYVKDMCIETMSALYKICKVHIASGNYTVNMSNFVNLVESTAAAAPKSYAETSGTRVVSLFDGTSWTQTNGSYSFGDSTTALPYALMACAEVDDGSGLTAVSIAGIGLNPAIAILDLMTHERGYNLRFEAIDIDSFLKAFFYYKENKIHVNLVSAKTSEVKSVIESILMDTYSITVTDKNQSTYGIKCLLQDDVVKHELTDAEIISVSSLKKYDVDAFNTKVILNYEDVITDGTSTIVETAPQHDVANGKTLEYTCETASSAVQARRIASTLLNRFSKPYAVIVLKIQDNSGDYKLGDLCSVKASSVGFMSTGMRIIGISNEFNNISGEMELTLQEDINADSFYFEVDVPAGVGISAKFPKEAFMLQASQAHLSLESSNLDDMSDHAVLVMTPPENPSGGDSGIALEKDEEIVSIQYSLFVKLVSEVVDCPVANYPDTEEKYIDFINDDSNWTSAFTYNSMTDKGGSLFCPVVSDSIVTNGSVVDYRPVYRHKLKISHNGLIAGNRSAGEVAALTFILKENFGDWNMLYYPMAESYPNGLGKERESALVKTLGHASDGIYVKIVRGVFNEIPSTYPSTADLLLIPSSSTNFYAKTAMYISCRTGLESTFQTSSVLDGFDGTSSGLLTAKVEGSGRFGDEQQLKLEYLLAPYGTSSDGAPYHSSVYHKSGFYLGTGRGLSTFTSYKRFDVKGLHCSSTRNNGGLVSWTSTPTDATLPQGGTYYKEAILAQNGGSFSNLCWKVGTSSAYDPSIPSLNGSLKLNATPYDANSIAEKVRTLSVTWSTGSVSDTIIEELTQDSGTKVYTFDSPVTTVTANYTRYNLAPTALELEPLIFGNDAEFTAASTLRCENLNAIRTDPNFRVCAIKLEDVFGFADVQLQNPVYDQNSTLIGYTQATVTYTTFSNGDKLDLTYPDVGYEFEFEAKQGSVCGDLFAEPVLGDLALDSEVNSGNSRYQVSSYGATDENLQPDLMKVKTKVISELIGKPVLMAPRFKPNRDVDADTAMTQLLSKLNLFYGQTITGSIRTYPMISVPFSSANNFTLRNWIPEQPYLREHKPFTFDCRASINTIRNAIAADRRPEDLFVAYDFVAASGLVTVVNDFVNPEDGLTYKAFAAEGPDSAGNVFNVLNFGSFYSAAWPIPKYRIFSCSFKL